MSKDEDIVSWLKWHVKNSPGPDDYRKAKLLEAANEIARLRHALVIASRNSRRQNLARLEVGQPARLRVEAFGDEVFRAKVLRIRPTIEASTGTVTVTLEVDGRGQLRPGMFASVQLETDTHENALVIPRSALVLDSIGDTVFVRDGASAARREVSLGFREESFVEVLEGLEEGEELIVLGQDGLADGTPISLLADAEDPPTDSAPGARRTASADGMSDEQIEMMRQRMRDRGLSDEQIEERLQQIRSGGGRPGAAAGGPPVGPRGAGGGGIPPRMEQRIRDASPEDLEQIKERMKSFGMTDEQIDELVKRIREEAS